MLRTPGRRVANTRAFSASHRAMWTSTHSTATGLRKINKCLDILKFGLLGFNVYQVYEYSGRLQKAEEAHISASLIPKPVVLVGLVRVKDLLLSGTVQVLGALPTTKAVMEPLLSELSDIQEDLATTFAAVGRHAERKAVLLRAGEVHKRLFGDNFETHPTYIRGRLCLASAHAMLGEWKEAGVIVDSAVRVLQAQGELTEDREKNVRLPLLRVQALIKAATGHTQEALKLLQDVHKMMGPMQTDSGGVQTIQGLFDLHAQLAKTTISTDMARIAATKCSDRGEVKCLVQDAYLAYQGTYWALEPAIKAVDGFSGHQQRANTFGIQELSPEERSSLRRSLATSEQASYCLRAGLGPLARLVELPITPFDKGARGFKFDDARVEQAVKYYLRLIFSYTWFFPSAVADLDISHLIVAAVIGCSGIGQAVGTTDDGEEMLRMAQGLLDALRGSRIFFRFSDDDDALRWLELWHKVEAVEALEVLAHAYM